MKQTKMRLLLLLLLLLGASLQRLFCFPRSKNNMLPTTVELQR